MTKWISASALFSLLALMNMTVMSSIYEPEKAVKGKPPVPKVYLNHFFIIVDQKTYEALKSSAFLRDKFAVFEERTTASGSQTWSGLYFYGKSTYLEFMSPESLTGQHVGDCSIALGVENQSDTDTLMKKTFDKSLLPLERAVLYRESGGQKVPWFHLVEPKKKTESPWFESWVMEYHEDFLHAWCSDAVKTRNNTRRESILNCYRQRLEKDGHAQPKLLEDFIGLTVALPPDDYEQFSKWLAALGYRSVKKNDGLLFSGPEIHIEIRHATSLQKGITEARLLLSSPWKGSYKFGDRINLKSQDDKYAIWNFRFP
jgi:hypothetical protein